MRRINTILLALMLNFLAYSQANADIWYVTPTGAGNQTGTDRDNAWSMTSMNQSVLQPGDFVYFGQGTYTDRLTPSASGTSMALITYMADPMNTDTVWISRGSFSLTGCSIAGAQYIQIKKLAFKNCGTAITVGQNSNVIYFDSLIARNVEGAFWVLGKYDGTNPTPATSEVDSIWVRWCDFVLSLKQQVKLM